MSPSGKDNSLERYAAIWEEARRIKGVSLGRDAWRRLRRNRVAMLSLIFLVTLCVLAIFTPLLPLAPPHRLQTSATYAPPTFSPLFTASLAIQDEHGAVLDSAVEEGFGKLNAFDFALVRLRTKIFGDWTVNSLCGRDHLGRDMLARLFWGARLSLTVALIATCVSLLIGVTYGAVSGYVGGFVDDAMMRFVDFLYSVPFIFVVIFLISILSEGQTKKFLAENYYIDRVTIFYIVVGAIYWLTMARVVRGQVISLKNEQFVEAARTIGAGGGRIIFHHLVPNLLSVIIVYLTLTIPRVMLFEAFLSFLGLGVEEPNVSWGLLANSALQVINPVRVDWWLVTYPSLALGLTLFSLNFFGDGLRDALDPRLKHR